MFRIVFFKDTNAVKSTAKRVNAESAQEAVDAIRAEFPDCKVLRVFQMMPVKDWK